MFNIKVDDNGMLFVNLGEFHSKLVAPINVKVLEKCILRGKIKGKDYRYIDDACEISVVLARQVAELFGEEDVVSALNLNVISFDVWQMKLDKANAEIERLKAKITADAPKVLFCNVVSAAEGNVTLSELNGILASNGVCIGANKMCRIMREQGFLSKKPLNQNVNIPTQEAIEKGLLTLREKYIDRKGSIFGVPQTLVTQRGLAYFINTFVKYAIDKPLPTITIEDEAADQAEELQNGGTSSKAV